MCLELVAILWISVFVAQVRLLGFERLGFATGLINLFSHGDLVESV
jgi:hypothetical protein